MEQVESQFSWVKYTTRTQPIQKRNYILYLKHTHTQMLTDATPHSAKNKKIKFFSVRRARTNLPPKKKKASLWKVKNNPDIMNRAQVQSTFFSAKQNQNVSELKMQEKTACSNTD